MKYQKSMMKIIENFLTKRKEMSIETIIHETKTGRNSSFEAINWLVKNGILKVRKNGKQRLFSLVLDNNLLQFKHYLDSISFKNLDSLVKLVVNVFVLEISNKPEIKEVLLFGSVLGRKKFQDIDLLILGNSLDVKFMNSLMNLRDKIERVFGIILNLHRGDFDIEEDFRGVTVYQSSYFPVKDKSKKQYLEFFNWAYEAIKNKNSSSYKMAFDNSVLGLSYSYSLLNDFEPKTKLDSLSFLSKKYKIGNINQLKKAGVEIGKELFK